MEGIIVKHATDRIPRGKAYIVMLNLNAARILNFSAPVVSTKLNVKVV